MKIKSNWRKDYGSSYPPPKGLNLQSMGRACISHLQKMHAKEKASQQKKHKSQELARDFSFSSHRYRMRPFLQRKEREGMVCDSMRM